MKQCERCGKTFDELKFKINGRPVSHISVHTPLDITICNWNLCNTCMRDFYHFMMNEDVRRNK